MTRSRTPHRVCPTRIDRRAALVIHKVTVSQCQDRQRGQYHKCFTCAYNHAFVAKYGEPQVREGKVEPARLPKLLEVPASPEESPEAESEGAKPTAAKAAS